MRPTRSDPEAVHAPAMRLPKQAEIDTLWTMHNHLGLPVICKAEMRIELPLP